MRLCRVRLILLTLATRAFAPAHGAYAQARTDTTASDTTASDTTASAAASEVTQAFWISVGAGRGNIKSTGESLTGMIRLNFSSGLALLTYRGSDNGPFESGDGLREDAFLIGVRSSNHRVFGGAAVGFASALPYHDCQCETPQSARAREFGLADDLTAHANARIIGFALGVAGIVGPAKASYHAFTASVELGRFGP